MELMAGRESQWFRVACVTVVAAVCLPPIAEALLKAQPGLAAKADGDPVRVWGPLAVLGTVALLLSAAFALASWVATRPREPETASAFVHGLLGLQLFGCYAITVELVPLVSAQAGASLPWKQAWRWQAAIMAIVLLVAVLSVQDGSFEPATGLTHLPRGGQIVATVGNLLAWSAFASWPGG